MIIAYEFFDLLYLLVGGEQNLLKILELRELACQLPLPLVEKVLKFFARDHVIDLLLESITGVDK